MYKKDVRLFGKAIVEGLSSKFEQELANSTESVLCSEEHKAAMLEIIATGKAIEQRMGKKRLIAILVAATLLLFAGCTAYVYRNEIGSFVENIYEEYVNVELPEDDNVLTEIEHAYTLSYIPDGYVLTDEIAIDAWIMYQYTNDREEIIEFNQYPMGATIDIGIDNDNGDVEVIKYENVEIYIRATEKKKHYVWYDEDYAFTLTCSKEVERDEVLKIIDGME